jgi:hypothetical protein
VIRDSAFPIAADLFLAALTHEEHDGVKMRVNDSCEPNVGMGGNVLLVSMRISQLARSSPWTMPCSCVIPTSPCNAGAPPRPAGVW